MLNKSLVEILYLVSVIFKNVYYILNAPRSNPVHDDGIVGVRRSTNICVWELKK